MTTEQSSKVVIFVHHHDVVAALAQEFGDSCVTLTGEDSIEKRQIAVDRFQTDPTCRVFIGSLKAAGVGITLTAAHHVVFGELDWVPGNMSQAEDRCHRIGQKDNVLVQHLVLEGSLDSRMARVLIEKQAVIDAALDEIAQEPVVPVVNAPVTVARKEYQQADEHPMPAEQVRAIHHGLRLLKAHCDGAFNLDGQGFSKIDVRVGHSLAMAQSLTQKQALLGKKLVNKYRRQLPEDLLAVALGRE